jgi:hypothetical protein
MAGSQEDRTLRIFSLIACLSLSLLLPSYFVCGEDLDRNSTITLQKDKEKTVYSIGPSDESTVNEDTEKAWDMLRGAVIDARGSFGGKGSDNNR